MCPCVQGSLLHWQARPQELHHSNTMQQGNFNPDSSGLTSRSPVFSEVVLSRAREEEKLLKHTNLSTVPLNSNPQPQTPKLKCKALLKPHPYLEVHGHYLPMNLQAFLTPLTALANPSRPRTCRGARAWVEDLQARVRLGELVA